jgi:TRAP-type transport system periplasmic protein
MRLLSLSLIALLMAPPATAADKNTIVVKIGTVAPDGTPWAKWMGKITRRVTKKSTAANIAVKYKLYTGGRLGGEKEMVEECRLGRLPMFGGSMGALATAVPALNVFELPYLFQSNAEADHIIDEVVWDRLFKLLDQSGFVLLAMTENGWHGVATRGTPILKLEDFVGRKMRVQQSKVHLEAFKALGASPVEMGVPEVLSALQNKVVDGFSNTPLFSFATNWYRAIDHFSVTRHIYQPAALVASKKWFNKLPKDLQKILLDPKARKKETRIGRKWVRALDGPLLQQFEANGKKVHHPSKAELARMAKAAQKSHRLFRKYGGKAGSDLLDLIQAGLKKKR